MKSYGISLSGFREDNDYDCPSRSNRFSFRLATIHDSVSHPSEPRPRVQLCAAANPVTKYFSFDWFLQYWECDSILQQNT